MRKMERGKTRLVVQGTSAAPTEMTAEYRVVDGDMAEPSQRLPFEGTDFSQPVSSLWGSAVSAVKSAEKLD